MKFVRIKDIMSVNRGSSPRPISNTAYFSETGTYGWVRISDVTKSDKHLFNTEERLSELGASFSVKLDKPTLFLSIAGSVGKACINKIPVCIHDGFVYFSSIKNYDINYLFWFFSNSIIYEGLGKKGVFLNLNIDTIKNILIPKLKIDEQLKISKFLDTHCLKIDNEVSLLQQKSILLDEYKNALIYETVTKGLDKNAEMMDSGVEWIGEIPKHWSVNRLKDKLNIQKGAVFTDDLIKDDGVYPYINGGIKPSGLTNSFNCRENTIAVSEGGASSGYSQFMETKFWAGTHCYKINPKRNENSKYYYYLLKGFEKQIQAAKTGSAMPNLQKSKFINLVFSFTSNLKEQNEIVKYLDNETKKIEKQIGLINKKVELLKEYKQSLIYEAVTGQLEIE